MPRARARTRSARAELTAAPRLATSRATHPQSDPLRDTWHATRQLMNYATETQQTTPLSPLCFLPRGLTATSEERSCSSPAAHTRPSLPHDIRGRPGGAVARMSTMSWTTRAVRLRVAAVRPFRAWVQRTQRWGKGASTACFPLTPLWRPTTRSSGRKSHARASSNSCCAQEASQALASWRCTLRMG